MIAQGHNNILPEELDEVSILRYYLGIVTLPTVINSPLREDNTPSFGLIINEKNRIYYHDFANSDSGDLFTLLGKLWGTGYYGVLTTLHKDKEAILSKKTKTNYNITYCNKHKKQISKFKVRIREWKQWDLEYWQDYGISKEWLEFGRIYPISHIFIEYNKQNIAINCEKYAYVYIEYKDKTLTYKVYQPFSEYFKWRSGHDLSVWDLWRQLPKKGDNLIITSSRKDALCIWANTGIPCVSLQGEGYVPKEQVIDTLKKRFKTIYILYDNDYDKMQNHGRINASKIAKKFNIKQIEIHEDFKAKDPSDLYKKHGRTVLIQTILKLINYVILILFWVIVFPVILI